MTPKEKAWQLIEDMSFSTSGLLDRSTGKMIPYQVPANPHVKDCALIVVKEVLENLGYDPSAPGESEWFWKEVKQEIEKL